MGPFAQTRDFCRDSLTNFSPLHQHGKCYQEWVWHISLLLGKIRIAAGMRSRHYILWEIMGKIECGILMGEVTITDFDFAEDVIIFVRTLVSACTPWTNWVWNLSPWDWRFPVSRLRSILFSFSDSFFFCFLSCFPDDLTMTPWDSSESYSPWALPWASGFIFYNNDNNSNTT